jgi:hypothetical protein
LTQKLSEDMENNLGIRSSLDEDDIKDYIYDVLSEIDKSNR